MLYPASSLNELHRESLRHAFNVNGLEIRNHYLPFLRLLYILNEFSITTDNQEAFDRIVDFCQKISDTKDISYRLYAKFSDSVLFNIAFFPDYFDHLMLDKNFYRSFAARIYASISRNDIDVFSLMSKNFRQYEYILSCVGRKYI